MRSAAFELCLPGSCKARCRIADAVRHECWRMTNCLYFHLDLPMRGGHALALTRFGTAVLSALSAFETVTGRGYHRGPEHTRLADVSN